MKHQSEVDVVNHPPHYTLGNIEVIDFIEDQVLGYHLGNAIKYICRAGRKEGSDFATDLKKARWYLDRKIKEVEKLDEGSIDPTGPATKDIRPR